MHLMRLTLRSVTPKSEAVGAILFHLALAIPGMPTLPDRASCREPVAGPYRRARPRSGLPGRAVARRLDRGPGRGARLFFPAGYVSRPRAAFARARLRRRRHENDHRFRKWHR